MSIEKVMGAQLLNLLIIDHEVSKCVNTQNTKTNKIVFLLIKTLARIYSIHKKFAYVASYGVVPTVLILNFNCFVGFSIINEVANS